MRHVWKTSKEFSLGCLCMAAIFSYTSICKLRVNDEEWSLYFPRYAVAALVCCYHAFRFNSWSRVTAYGLIVGSAAVFLGEVSGYVGHWSFDWQAFVSLDMQKRDVREKLGSVLIMLSMGLQLDAFEGLFATRRCLEIVTASTALLSAYIVKRHGKEPLS